MAVEWTNLAEAFIAGGFPWISQFKELEIHFKLEGARDLRTIFNFFGSLFATSIYGYSIYAHPIDVVSMPAWWVFMLIALFLSVLYFALFLCCGASEAGTSPIAAVVIGFLIYIGIFCNLTAGFGVLRVFENYYILRGAIVESATGAPVPGAEIDLKGSDNYWALVRADDHGEFVHLVARSDLDKINEIAVTKAGYSHDPMTVPQGFSVPPLIRRIEIRTEE